MEKGKRATMPDRSLSSGKLHSKAMGIGVPPRISVTTTKPHPKARRKGQAVKVKQQSTPQVKEIQRIKVGIAPVFFFVHIDGQSFKMDEETLQIFVDEAEEMLEELSNLYDRF